MKFDTDQRSLAKTLNKAELSARFGSDKLQGVTHRPRIGTAECGASGKMQDGRGWEAQFAHIESCSG